MRNFEIKNENGRSMIEMLGVLAIIGVLSVGGIAGYSKAMIKYRINKTIEQITLIAGNVRTFFAPQRNYEGLTNAVIKKAKLVPDEMWNGGEIKNVWGGTIWLEQADKSLTNDHKAFSLQMDPDPVIPMEACIELTSQDWSSAGVTSIGIGYTKYQGWLKTPVSLDKAIEVCSTAYEKNDGDVYYSLSFDEDVNSDLYKNVAWKN